MSINRPQTSSPGHKQVANTFGVGYTRLPLVQDADRRRWRGAHINDNVTYLNLLMKAQHPAITKSKTPNFPNSKKFTSSNEEGLVENVVCVKNQ